MTGFMKKLSVGLFFNYLWTSCYDWFYEKSFSEIICGPLAMTGFMSVFSLIFSLTNSFTCSCKLFSEFSDTVKKEQAKYPNYPTCKKNWPDNKMVGHIGGISAVIGRSVARLKEERKQTICMSKHKECQKKTRNKAVYVDVF